MSEAKKELGNYKLKNYTLGGTKYLLGVKVNDGRIDCLLNNQAMTGAKNSVLWQGGIGFKI